MNEMFIPLVFISLIVMSCLLYRFVRWVRYRKAPLPPGYTIVTDGYRYAIRLPGGGISYAVHPFRFRYQAVAEAWDNWRCEAKSDYAQSKTWRPL